MSMIIFVSEYYFLLISFNTNIIVLFMLGILATSCQRCVFIFVCAAVADAPEVSATRRIDSSLDLHRIRIIAREFVF